MALDSDAEIKEIQGRKGYTNALTNGQEDLSGGVEHVIGNVPAVTVYLSAAGSVSVKFEASPDGGTTWFTLPESPVEFTGAGDDVIHIKYNLDRLRLTATNTTGVQAVVREVM